MTRYYKNVKIVSIDTYVREKGVWIIINTSKYTNHTKEEISEYLNIVKKNIKRGKYIICTNVNNEKNKKFIEKYKLDSNKQKEMLNQLKVEDFCYSVDNYNQPDERLYIFCKEYELNNWGTIIKIEVYIKIVIKEYDFIVIVSFHEPEKRIKKLF